MLLVGTPGFEPSNEALCSPISEAGFATAVDWRNTRISTLRCCCLKPRSITRIAR